MKAIMKLYKQVHAKTFEAKYPNYCMNDRKVHVLYLSACINETGWYRVMAPYYELNQTATHSAIIANIHRWDFNKLFEDYDNPVDERLIIWADYVVLPVLFSDVSYILKAFYQINESLQFVMDINGNYDLVSNDHLLYKNISQLMKDQLLVNISKMDVLTASSQGILKHYDTELMVRFPDVIVHLAYLPSLYVSNAYEHLKTNKYLNSDVVTIGITANESNDLAMIREMLFRSKEKHGEKVTFIVLGWNGESMGIFKGLDIVFKRPVGFMKYFEALSALHLDLVLLPLAKSSLDMPGSSSMRFHEMAALGIPVVTSHSWPYASLIKHKRNGYLAQSTVQWVSAIDALVSDAALRKRMGSRAQKAVQDCHALKSATLNHYLNLFTWSP